MAYEDQTLAKMADMKRDPFSGRASGAAMIVDPTATPDQMPSVSKEALMASGAMDSVDREIGLLEERLQYVLLPASADATAVDGEAEERTSALGEQLRATRRQITNAAIWLEHIRHRLTV